MKKEFYISGYSPSDEKGIIRYRIDTETREITEISHVTGIESPTYMVPHPNGKVIYSGEKHSGEGEVVSYVLDGNEMRVASKLPTGGISPCHVALDPSCGFLFAANYATGSLAVFKLDENGALLTRTDFRQFQGHSVNPSRQESAHLHFSLCTGETVYACDLGEDIVWVFDFDRTNGRLIDTDRNIRTHPGDGPRHLAIHEQHPGFLYLITEMASTVYVLREKTDGYEPVQKIRSVPEPYNGPENTAAAIRFTADGTRLIVSNRGDNSLAVFQVLEDGTLKSPEFGTSGGDGPRDFNIFDDILISANQFSGDIAVYRLDGTHLIDLGIRTNFGHPSCVQPVL